MNKHRCPEAVIVGELRGIPLVIRCDLNGGHPGNHAAETERGECDWPRIAGIPARYDDPPLAATRRCTVHDQTYTAACPGCRAGENAEGEAS